MRVNGSGGVSWVSKAGWKLIDLKDFTPRALPLVAPLKNNRLLVYGGLDKDHNVLYDGVIIDTTRKTVINYFR